MDFYSDERHYKNRMSHGLLWFLIFICAEHSFVSSCEVIIKGLDK